MTIRYLLLIGLIAAVAFGYREVRSWSVPTVLSVVSPRQRSLRLTGLFCLICLLGFGLGGTFLTLPQTAGHAHDPRVLKAVLSYLGYWLLTSLFFLPLVPIALADTRENVTRLNSDLLRLQAEKEALRSLEVDLKESGADDST